jgi:hypothetical protein
VPATLSRLQVLEPVSECRQPASGQALDAPRAVGLDDGWGVCYRYFPAGGRLPPLPAFCPNLEVALGQGVPPAVVEQAFHLLVTKP